VAVCTAFAGAVAFVGLAIPHITRIGYKTTNHFVLFTGNILTGPLILGSCDIICQLPGEQFVLPINAVTSILGAPLAVYLMLQQNRGSHILENDRICVRELPVAIHKFYLQNTHVCSLKTGA